MSDYPIRIGINPLSWMNDDLPSLGGETPLSVALTEGRQIGYEGFELGNSSRASRRRSRRCWPSTSWRWSRAGTRGGWPSAARRKRSTRWARISNCWRRTARR